MSEGFVPLSRTLPFWPSDAFGDGDFLDRIGIREFTLTEGDGELGLEGILLWIEEIAIAFPGLQGIELVLLASEDGSTAIPFDVRVLPDFELALPNISVTLRFANDLLRPVRREDDAWVPITQADGSPAPAEVTLSSVGMKVGIETGVDVLMPAGAPMLSLGAVALGDTGIVLEVDGLRLYLSRNQTPPEGAPTGFQGVTIESVRLHFPPGLYVPLSVDRLEFENLMIGTGGFSGLIRGAWTPATFNTSTRRFEGDGAGTFLGIAFALHAMELRFAQNIPSDAGLTGALHLPFLESPLTVDLNLGIDGDFRLALAGLATLTLSGLIRIDVTAVSAEVTDDVFTFTIAGKLTPLLGGLDWPAFDVRRLAITSEGDVSLDGGWINLPETCSLDFHAFKIDIDEVGLGKNEERAREWFGLSGSIRLIEGIPLSASVDGLQFSWDPADPPTASDPLHGVQVTLEGVAVHLEIPGTLVLDGSVRYREIPCPFDVRNESDSTAAQAGVFGHVFTGSISLNITALRTQVAGELLIGELTQYAYDDTGALVIGETFPAFYIVLSAQLPFAIPLGATGTGVYGLEGLFGMHVAPNRQLAENEPEAWYEWYKAERGDQSAYSVTKVVKWAPRFDNYAFGAGLTIGTIYDDGFTINAGALIAILLPGPVIMIEGKANLLKQRGGSGSKAEGTLYALIVFDGLAETFAMNVDINYALEDVITVGGGMEAFFDFNDNSIWYIYIGRKDPESKRIRAEVISIISASAYFMVDPRAIVFGAVAGLDLKLEYQPLVIRLILRIAFEIGLFFKQPQLTGFVELYGEISILIFGWGIKLILQTLLEGSAPQPWWIHGLARVEVSLPFPLPSFEAQVEFTWGESEQPARVPLLLGASAIHPKELGRSWKLSTTAKKAPIVPVDAIAVLSLGKPLSQVSTERNPNDGSLQWFDYETVEGWEFRYQLTRVTLRAVKSGTIVGEGPLDTHRPWLNPLGRILTDAGPSDSPDAPPVAAPQVQLWGYSPLDAQSPAAQSHYRDPCEESSGTLERHCVHWRNAAVGLEYGRVFTYQDLSFSTSSAHVHRIGSDPPFLRCQTIDIRFPEPVSQVVVQCSGLSHASARLRGSNVWDAPFRDGELSIPGTIDCLRLTLASGRGPVAPHEVVGLALVEICYVVQRSIDRIPGSGDLSSANRANQIAKSLLRPNTLYALEVVAERGERIVGDEEFRVPAPESQTFYFHTGAAPGLNLTTAQVEAAAGLSETERDAHLAIDFRDGRLNELSSYIQRTTPEHGAPTFYGGYDVVVRFDMPYLAALFDDALTLRISDQNGHVVVGDASRWITGLLPLITPGLAAFLRAPRERNCADGAKPWSPHLPRELVCSLPDTLRRERLYRAEILAEGKVLHSFAFTLSRFRDFHDHFAPGWDRFNLAPHTPIVRSGVSFNALIPIDLSRYGSLLTAWRAARERLSATLAVGEHDSGVSLDQALTDLTASRAALDDFMQENFAALDAAVQPSFEALGLGHRPRPPKLELVSVAQGTEVIYFLDSPEPVERTRLSITRSDSGAAVYPVWNGDGTRAFLFNSSRASGAFAAGAVELELTWTRGGLAAPDVPSLYLAGRLDSSVDTVRWSLTAS